MKQRSTPLGEMLTLYSMRFNVPETDRMDAVGVVREREAIMCDCHQLTPEQREAINATEGEPNTVEDWRELHDLIETYRMQRAARHVKAHVERSDPASDAEAR